MCNWIVSNGWTVGKSGQSVDKAGWTVGKPTHVQTTLLDRFEFVPLILMIHLNQKINAELCNKYELKLKPKIQQHQMQQKVERKT